MVLWSFLECFAKMSLKKLVFDFSFFQFRKKESYTSDANPSFNAGWYCDSNVIREGHHSGWMDENADARRCAQGAQVEARLDVQYQYQTCNRPFIQQIYIS